MDKNNSHIYGFASGLFLIADRVLRKGEKFIHFISEHKEAVADIIKNNLTKEVVERIRNHKILVSENAIIAEIRKYEQDNSWKLASLICDAEAIEFRIRRAIAKADITALFRIHIEKLILSGTEQTVQCRILEERLESTHLWAKIVCAVIKCFIGNFCRTALEQSVYKERVMFSSDGKKFSVDLHGIPAIESLCQGKVPQLDDSGCCKMISLDGVEHCVQGVFLKFSVSEQIKRIVQTCGHATKI